MTQTAKRIWLLVLIAGAVALPLLLGDYPTTMATEVVALSLFVLGINLLVGYAGLVSLGHALFLGLGGYGIAVGTLLLGWPLWLSVIGTYGGLIAIGAVVGFVCTRTAGIEFLLITLALSQMFYGVAVKLRVTGGDDGMAGIPRPDFAWAGLDTWDSTTFYYYALAVAALVYWLTWRFVNSPAGSVLVGIRENEKRMVALGYHVAWYKNMAFVASGLVSGTGGIVLAQYSSFINPESLDWLIGGEGLLMVIIGGPRAFFGPLAGTIFFVVLKERLSEITDEYFIFFGLLFMLVVALLRGGLAGVGAMLAKGRLAALIGRRPT